MRSSDIHFWRSRQGAGIDFAESLGAGKEIFAYECKWKEKITTPLSFKIAYPHARFECITTENIVTHFHG